MASTAQSQPSGGGGTQTQPQPSAQSTRTQTQTQTQSRTQAILRLRGAHAPGRPSVRWRDDVVDNEGLGRKRSKGKKSKPTHAALFHRDCRVLTDHHHSHSPLIQCAAYTTDQRASTSPATSLLQTLAHHPIPTRTTTTTTMPKEAATEERAAAAAATDTAVTANTARGNQSGGRAQTPTRGSPSPPSQRMAHPRRGMAARAKPLRGRRMGGAEGARRYTMEGV